jgi:cardiolipin synthase
MLVAKQVADLITFCRLLLAFFLAWLGFIQGSAGLPFAAWTMILSWTTDALDGPISRRSRISYRTWLGDHDLEVDIMVSLGLLVFFMFSGYLSGLIGSIYILAWVVVFWRWGVTRSLGMLSQAATYAYLIYLTLRFSLPEGIALTAWIIGVVVITWPRFPQEVVPGFLKGMRAGWAHKSKE